MLNISSAPTIYCSGIDREEHLACLAQEEAAGMINTVSLRSPRLCEAIRRYPRVRLTLDSGWQKACSFQEYIRILRRIDTDRFDWVTSYDIPGDQATSERYYDTLIRALPHLKAKILWVYQCSMQTTHRERRRQLERLAQRLSIWQPIGIGGLVPIIRHNPQEAWIILQELGDLLSTLAIPAHIFGISSFELLRWLRTQSWVQSVDTSKWLIGWKAREVLLIEGGQRKAADLRVPLTPAECAALNMRTLTSWFRLTPSSPTSDILWAHSEEVAPDEASWPTSRQLARLLLRYRAQEVALNDSASATHVYLPLCSYEGRECGLLSWDAAMLAKVTSTTEWSIVWDIRDGDPPLPPPRLFRMHGCLTSGLFAQDDPFLPSLCHYPLTIAVAVARACFPG